MVDVLYTVSVSWKQRNLVMHGVDAQQRRGSNPVAHPSIACLGPELLVSLRGLRVKTHVRKSRDSRVSRRRIAAAAVPRARDQVYRGSRGLLEHYAGADTALLALRRGALMHRVAGIFKLACCSIERVVACELECDGVIVWISRRVNQGVVALVRAQIDRTAILPRQLQADDLGRELDRAGEIIGSEADISDIVQRNHELRSTI